MSLTTRKPTGRPPWPMLLLAGKQKTGKSFSAALASSSKMIGRTLWIGIGESDPDEYGALPGADFEIVEHDGTFRGIGNAIHAAVQEPQDESHPTLIVVDSITNLWEQIKSEMQQIADRRAAEKAQRYKRPAPAEDVQISMDLWNKAKDDRWKPIMRLLHSHTGPVILTARLAETVAMDADGKPTTDRTWTIQGHKDLPFDVDGIVEMRSREEVMLTGVRSLVADVPVGQHQHINDFSVEKLWNHMGLKPETVAPRTVSEVNPGGASPVSAPSAQSPEPEPEPTQTRRPSPEDPWQSVVGQNLRQAWDNPERLRKAVKFLSREGHPLLDQAQHRLEEITQHTTQAREAAPEPDPSGPSPDEARANVQETFDAELVEEPAR